MITSYGLGTTPATLIIDQGGYVIKKFNGAYLRSKPAVEDFFKVRLPGLRDGAF
jgi:hypothetical protein